MPKSLLGMLKDSEAGGLNHTERWWCEVTGRAGVRGVDLARKAERKKKAGVQRFSDCVGGLIGRSEVMRSNQRTERFEPQWK